GEARLDVFDITGRHVQTLARGPLSAGAHEVLFDARDLPSGVYFARLAAGEFVQTRRMLLVR
ncbi:T9SS type A sorting domain-containing protein, partial [bacterium]|nr:T9SS type A sorting domain-containing protein [bacterium]MBU1983456.1 T9SS type A sorting domain-containing protein [bacterium]